MEPWTVWPSGSLLSAARAATLEAKPHNPGIAIVFAALSVEAFLNEVGESVRLYSRTPRLLALSGLLAQADEEHASTELKWALVVYGLTGTLVQKGSKPFQDLALLLRLRNVIVHCRPSRAMCMEEGDTPPELPRLVTAFISRGILAKPNPEVGQLYGGTSYLLRPPVAPWAVDTAVNCREYLGTLPREKELRLMLSALATSPRRAWTDDVS